MNNKTDVEKLCDTFNVFREDRQAAGCAADDAAGSSITEIGDGRFLAAGREIDATGKAMMAPFVIGARGWKVRRWLDADALDRLARLGVGTVRWVVKSRRLEDAEAHARRLAAPGRARLEPEAAPPVTTWTGLSLTGPPTAPRSDALPDVLEALGVAELDLGWLWPDPGKPSPPAIRRGQPASFLLIAPADLDHARLVAVWLDGLEVGTD